MIANLLVGRNTNEKMESNERTPLIATVPIAPRRPRYAHSTVRRFCTIALCCTLIAAGLLFILPVGALFPGHRHGHRRNAITYEELQEILLATPEPEKAREWSYYYTSGAHLAGKNYSQVLWTQEKWEEFGIQANIATYDTYINYPVSHRLALYEKNEKRAGRRSEETWKLKFEASLEEDVLDEDPTTGVENRIPTFHGYSASGKVTAPFVYVNYGTYQDYEDLINANISVKGKIVLARYGGVFRGLKIKRAQDLGAVGAVLFTDPGDDGPATSDQEAYPNGPGRNPSSVQRGSAQFLSFAPGDPTTPGYPSLPGVPRQPVDNAIPSIPSIPISYVDAIPILKSLNGIGLAPKSFNKYWQRNLGLKDEGVEYNVGPSPDSLVLNLVNEQDYVTTPLWDVIGVINGTIQDEVIVIGNHRDAWIVGGAGDPNSGSAALNEVIRSFGVALSKGWKPLRTIVFASWDGEEYGLIGSTEWVEEYLPWLTHANVAYVNVDVATTGPVFSAAANPLLNKILYEITDLVTSPNQTVPGQTVGDLWDGRIKTMGSGSDFTAFQDFAGIPSIDFGFGPNPEAPGDTGGAVYHYHSNYDSFHWMDNYGDPGFHYHVAIAKMWALYTARLAETPVIPFNATDYAIAIQDYIASLERKIDSVATGTFSEEENIEARARPTPSAPKGSLSAFKLSLASLNHASDALLKAARKHDKHASHLAEKAASKLPWWKFISRIRLFWAIRKVNTSYKYLDRKLLYSEGLDGRSWFKHVIYAPGLWTGYAGAVFPGLSEAVDARDWANAARWIEIIAERITNAGKSLT
jgi:N-acetylated-alpha-linked acidic dipeptidase